MSSRPSISDDARAVAELLDALPAALCVLRGPEHLITYANPRYEALAGGASLTGRTVADAFPEPENAPFIAALDHVYATGEPQGGREAPAIAADIETGTGHGPLWLTFTFLPLRASDGSVEGVLAFAVDVTAHVQARQSAEAAQRRWQILFDADVVGVAVSDPEHIYEANDAYLGLIGRSRAELPLSWRELTPVEWKSADDAAVAKLRDGDGRVAPFEKEYQRADGTRVPVLIAVAILQQHPTRFLVVAVDLGERKRSERERELLLARERSARRAAEESAQRIVKLQAATSAVASAIEGDDVGERIVRAGIELLGADAGTIAVPDGENLLLTNAIGLQEHKLAMFRSHPIEAELPLSDAYRERRTVLVEDRSRWERQYPAMAGAINDFPALACFPLMFGDRVLGLLGLSWRSPQNFTDDDIALAESFASQCGLALERARLFEQRAYVARTLQAGLLPRRLASVEGMDVAVRYRSISDGGEVGGDFYDLFSAGQDRWLMVVGDVCGKGTQAAVLTGLARNTIRAVALREREPAAVLGRLNEAILAQATDPAFVTVACALIERAGDGFECLLASAGHPYPLLLPADGPVREIPVTGTMLGVSEDPFLEQVELKLSRGDTLVAYTDGVVDARVGREHFGEQRLIAALDGARADGASADAIAGKVDLAMRRFAPGAPRDDAALLVCRVV